MHFHLATVVALFSSVLLTACCGPYECRAAIEGREKYAPIISALESYKAEVGTYPQTLAQLVPTYIDAIPGQDSERRTEPEYARIDDSYILGFQYFGPGSNSCHFSPENEWECYGAN
jgi:hypothetical protein